MALKVGVGHAVRIALGIGIAGFAWPGPAVSQMGAGGGTNGNPASTIAEWENAAREGSLDAKLQLGLAHDLGLGVPRDPSAAYRWYLAAAEAGHPDAQFNVAVMLDSQFGMPSGRSGAPFWYARAAANGHARAQYNLGLIYSSGEGVPRNPDLAQYWFGQAAASLPAAKEQLRSASISNQEKRTMRPPGDTNAAMVTLDGARFAELVWTAPPGPEGTEFLVEIASWQEDTADWSAPVMWEFTDASALVVFLEGSWPRLAWRVSRVDREQARYSSSGWQRLTGEFVALPDNDFPAALANRNRLAQQRAEEIIDAIIE